MTNEQLDDEIDRERLAAMYLPPQAGQREAWDRLQRLLDERKRRLTAPEVTSEVGP